MNAFVICEQDVQEVFGVLLSNVLHTKVVNYKGKYEEVCRVHPETQGVSSRRVTMGGEDRG